MIFINIKKIKENKKDNNSLNLRIKPVIKTYPTYSFVRLAQKNYRLRNGYKLQLNATNKVNSFWTIAFEGSSFRYRSSFCSFSSLLLAMLLSFCNFELVFLVWMSLDFYGIKEKNCLYFLFFIRYSRDTTQVFSAPRIHIKYFDSSSIYFRRWIILFIYLQSTNLTNHFFSFTIY